MVNGLCTNPMVLWPLVYGQNPMVLWPMVYGDKNLWSYGQWSMDENPWFYGDKKGLTLLESILFGSRSGTRTRVSTVRGWRANRYTNRPFGYISEIQSLPFEAGLFPVCECKVTNKFSLHQIFRTKFSKVFCKPLIFRVIHTTGRSPAVNYADQRGA